MGFVSERMAELVEARRKELRLEPKDLQRMTGLSGQAILNVRQGKVRRYTEGTINAIADALQWAPDWYDRILEGGTPVPTTETPPAQPDMAALMERMNAILEVGERRGAEMDRVAEAAFAAKAEQEALRGLLEAVAASGVRGMTELTAAVHELAVKVDRISRFVDWREAQLTDGRGNQGQP